MLEVRAFLNSILNILRLFSWNDIIDIIVVAFLIYHVIKLVRDTRAAQLVKGITLLVIAYLFAIILRLTTMKFVMNKIVEFGVIALVVVFQPELRRILEQVGQTRLFGNFSLFGNRVSDDQAADMWQETIITICDSADILAKEKVGALIVIERNTHLEEVVRTGTIVDAKPSAELIENIFFPNSPLHDGAVIVRDGIIYAAGCILPLSQNFNISKELGTRHRAALGISEDSDALAVVVSEETGLVSFAKNGTLRRGLDRERLQNILAAELIPNLSKKDTPKVKRFFGRFFK